jgi:2-octaprenyl-6-methoxyphenol hydroxylase
MNNSAVYDVIIIGGGMVGASLLAALRNHPDKKIALVEAVPFDSSAQPSFDDRSIALSYGSRRIFESLGLWQQIETQVEAIQTIHVSDRGHLGATRLHHHEERVEALGYVAENKVVGRVLMDAVQQLPHVDWYCPATIESLEQSADEVCIGIKSEAQIQQLRAHLLVAADGVHSVTRKLAGVDIIHNDYQQSAIITNLQTDQRHNGIAYERFTDSGPLAFLPMTENRYSVVWTCPRQQLQSLLDLTDAEFSQQLQQRFGFRAGNIKKVGARVAYPLVYSEAEQLCKGRVVMIGNAAHTLHPVAGQGYNLALRDVAELAELIVSADDPGEVSLLADYQATRLKDMRRIYRATDSLVKIFSNNHALLGHARAMGLISVDLLSPLRHLMARHSMGLAGRMNKLQRRLPL